MTQQDWEILQLARRIQVLSGEMSAQNVAHVRLHKIQELASALIPRLEAMQETPGKTSIAS